MQENIPAIFEKFNSLKALVVGDVMIDAYLWGKVDRISPEAPVPVISVTEKENRLGGAANVALNIAALGAEPIICALAGNDQKGEELRQLLEKQNMSTAGIVTSSSRPTTVKSRVICGHQHIVRVDEESLKPLNTKETEAFLENVKVLIHSEKPSVIIFEDYNKGVLTPQVIREIISLAEAENIPTAVDPKKANFFEYKKASLFKPNLKELAEGLKTDIEKKDERSLLKAVKALEASLENTISLVTLSEHGIFVKWGEKSLRIPAHLRNIADVSGAGDTVISVAALCLAAGTSPEFMAGLANLAGGIVCEYVGVVPISREQLMKEAQQHLTQL